MAEARAYSLKKRILIGLLLVLATALIVLRLYLSAWLLDYVNNVLANIPGYRGSVASINIDLYRGAYRINKLDIMKLNGKIPVPFVAIDVTDFSLQWSALFHGRIVSSAKLIHPVINFAVKDDAKQTGQEVDWTKPIKDLMPIDINAVTIDDGSITYQDFASTPRVDLYIHHMNGDIRNLRNVTNPDRPLPSTVDIRGESIGGGHLKIDGRANILKPTPDFAGLMALENVDLPAINAYPEAYAAFNFKSGRLSLYSQLNVRNNHVTGYIKPILTDLSVNVIDKPNPLEVAWSAVVAGVIQVFTNLSKDQFATVIEVNGTLDNVETDAWSAIGGIVRNAFVEAMKQGFEQTGNQNLIKQQKEQDEQPDKD